MFTRYLILFIAVAAYYTVQGNPIDQSEEFQRAMRRFQEESQRQFEEFQRRAQANFQHLPTLPPLDVKSLPNDGKSHVYGESQTNYHVETDINGRHSEESGGHKVINNDGKITEYDLP